MESDDQKRNDPQLRGQAPDYRPSIRRVNELRPHPGYERLRLSVPAAQLSAVAVHGDQALQQPILITQDGIVIDGYARWELARLRGCATISCVEYALNENEALVWLILKHHRSNSMAPFTRICLAIELEPGLRQQARAHEVAGGKGKGSSKLTEAERIDVRSEIARIAGVSVGNVTKVRQLIQTADQSVVEALHRREVSIHRAHRWNKTPDTQCQALWNHRSNRGLKNKIRSLISAHESNVLPTINNLGRLAALLSSPEANANSEVGVQVIKVPGKAIFLTEELFLQLQSQQNLRLT